MDELISRKAALDIVHEYARRLYEHVGTPEDNEMYSFGRGLLLSIERNLKGLPSAKPKVGKWERHYSRPNVYADLFWHCSECGYRSSDNWADKFNFCPNCGADMREVTP